MADYPDFCQTYESRSKARDTKKLDILADGNPRARDMGGPSKLNFAVAHRLTNAENETLQAFFKTKAPASLSFTYESKQDGLTYTVRFASTIRWEKIGPDAFNAYVDLVET